MALTAEQQAQLDIQLAQQKLANDNEIARRAYEKEILTLQHQVDKEKEATKQANEKELETIRHANQLAINKANADAQLVNLNAQSSNMAKQAKLEALRLAKEILIENRRTKPAASATDILASDIIAFANTLENHVNS